MDDLVRLLRDGSIGGRPAPLVLLQDSVSCIGGPAVAAKAAVDYCSAVKQRRAQAKEVLCVQSTNGSVYVDTCKEVLGTEAQVLQLVADNDRALEEIAEAVPLHRPAKSAEGAAESTTGSASTSGRCPDSKAAASPTTAVIVDSLSSLLFLHPEYKVLELLDKILQAPSVSCMLVTLHTDLHEARTVQVLERMAACVAELLPLPEAGSESAHAPDVFLETRIKQRTGRVKVIRDCYQLLQDGSLQEVKPEADAHLKKGKPAKPENTVAEDASKDAAVLAALAQKMGGSMRLTLTEQEAAARENVVLPWEQRQNGAQSQEDFMEAAAKPGLGQIMYERDSETDPDSDEDPDDDLDF